MKSLFAFIFLTLATSLCSAQVVLQPVHMSDVEFNSKLQSNKNYVSFSEFYLSTSTSWKSELDFVFLNWDESPPLSILKDSNLRTYLEKNVISDLIRKKINNYVASPLWIPHAQYATSDCTPITIPESFRLWINSQEVQNEVCVPQGVPVQMLFLSNKYMPYIFWGTVEEFKLFPPVPLIINRCDQQQIQPTYREQGYLALLEESCVQAMNKVIAKDQKSLLESYKRPLTLLFLAVAGIYAAGYEIVFF